MRVCKWTATALLALGLALGPQLCAQDQSKSQTSPAPQATPAPPAAKPADVASPDAILAAVYEVISGPAGQARDWDRFRALFLPDGRIVSLVPESAATKDRPARKGDAIFLTPDMFASRTIPTSRRTVSSSAASRTALRSLAILSRCGARPKSGCEGRCPAILARHRFVPDCACSRTLLDRQPSL